MDERDSRFAVIKFFGRRFQVKRSWLFGYFIVQLAVGIVIHDRIQIREFNRVRASLESRCRNLPFCKGREAEILANCSKEATRIPMGRGIARIDQDAFDLCVNGTLAERL